jgi:ribosomal large subunit pseudouridine synthase D
VNKPAGIPVHGSSSIDTLLSAASVLTPSAEPPAAVPDTDGRVHLHSLSFKPGPLHRLDKDTTGVLCFSRTLAGAQWFSQCLREKTVGKYYLGVVRGAMPAQPITAQDENGATMTQCYSVEYCKDIDASLMLFRLITGKKHQIRKHTESVGHPLAGDRKYHGGNPLPGCKHYLLHAWRLYFPALRPADIPASIEAPLFPEMETFLNRYFPNWRNAASSALIDQCYDKSNSSN